MLLDRQCVEQDVMLAASAHQRLRRLQITSNIVLLAAHIDLDRSFTWLQFAHEHIQ